MLVPIIKEYDEKHGTNLVIISESGIHSCTDARKAIDDGSRCSLIGTAIIKSDIYTIRPRASGDLKCTKTLQVQKRKNHCRSMWRDRSILNVDPTLIRLLWIFLIFLGGGGIPAYLLPG
jgi:hypothetical protein